ncbi:putative fructokinase [compost metagenome]
MAAGPALEARWKVKGDLLPQEHPAWEIEAFYIAQAISSVILLLSPKKVILGGGVMKQEQLFPMIREAVGRILNGYVSAAPIVSDIQHYIAPPKLGDNAGLCGALALGLRAFASHTKA